MSYMKSVEILFLLQFYVGTISSIIISRPSLDKTCQSDDGMFGYSIAVSKLSSRNLSILAVGKPWDCSVHYYYTSNPSSVLDLSTSPTSSSSETTGNFTFESVQWNYVGYVSDFDNGTFPSTPYSLFGYSVDLSEDAEFLSVGIPARSNSPPSTLEQKTQVGQVQIFRLQQNLTYQLYQIVNNPNPGTKFWHRFGSKVLFQKDFEDLYLFVTANHGWDGVALPGKNYWPLGNNKTTDVEYAGIYVYKFSNETSSFTFVQFIQQYSPVPMGSLGIDLDIGYVENDLVLYMRDYLPEVGGMVVEYTLNRSSNFFQESSSFSSSSFDAPKGLVLNNGYPLNSWESTDWFGYGISMAYDDYSNRYVLAIGAPKDATGVYTYYKQGQNYYYDYNEDGNTKWKSGAFILNEMPYNDSSFGQKVKFSKDGRFLVLANPSGTGSAKGKGQVFLYYRYSTQEQIYPMEWNPTSEPSSILRYDQEPPYDFTSLGLLGTFYNDTDPVISDHYGFGMGINEYFIVIGAPVEGCIYTFRFPIVISKAKPTRHVRQSTINVGTTAPGQEDYSARNKTMVDQAVIFGIVGGLIMLLVVVPGSGYVMIRLHKYRVMNKLKKAQALKSEDSLSGPTAYPSEQTLNE